MILSSGFIPRVFFRVFIARAFLSHTPPYVVFNTHAVKFSVPDQCLTLKFFFSRRLVEGSTSPATHFGRIFELSQEVFYLRSRVRNLPPFFLYFNEHFQAFTVSGLIPDPEFLPLMVNLWMWLLVTPCILWTQLRSMLFALYFQRIA